MTRLQFLLTKYAEAATKAANLALVCQQHDLRENVQKFKDSLLETAAAIYALENHGLFEEMDSNIAYLMECIAALEETPEPVAEIYEPPGSVRMTMCQCEYGDECPCGNIGNRCTRGKLEEHLEDHPGDLLTLQRIAECKDEVWTR